MFEAVPFHGNFENLWFFIRNPEIVGERTEDSPLHNSGQNFLISLMLLTTIMAFVQYLFPQLFQVDLALINPIPLSLLLAIQTVVFAFILALTTSLSLFMKKTAFHYLVAHQVIQAYAVLNFFLVVLFWLGINRIVKIGNAHEASSTLDLWFGGILGLAVLWLSWHLLISPLWGYTARYYSKKIALGITVTVLSVSVWLNSYFIIDFGEWVINKPVLCKMIFEAKKQQGEIDSSIDESCFIGHCMAQN